MLQLPRIQVQLVLGGEAAEVGVIDDAGHRFQGRNDHPALDLGQFLQVLAVGLQRVAVDLTPGTGHGIE